jgi:nucleoid-associated protein YgaU
VRRTRASLFLPMLAALLPTPALADTATFHIVKPGETLWSIASLAEIYGDPLLWPLIYRWNRDQIGNPGRIYPRQRLVIPTGVDPATLREVREEAKRKDP